MDPIPIDSPDLATVAQLVGQASSWCLQGEATIQTRLANYLFADSIFILSWATVYSAAPRSDRTSAILAMLALVSAILSGAWAAGGRRWRRYIPLQWDLQAQFESLLPENLRFGSEVKRLRDQGSISSESALGSEQTMVQVFDRVDKLVSINKLVVWVPSGLCLVSLALFGMSFGKV